MESSVETQREDFAQDGSVDLKGNPVLRSKRGGWKACSFVVARPCASKNTRPRTNASESANLLASSKPSQISPLAAVKCNFDLKKLAVLLPSSCDVNDAAWKSETGPQTALGLRKCVVAGKHLLQTGQRNERTRLKDHHQMGWLGDHFPRSWLLCRTR
ncbi:hypothetical protein ACLOJK_011301 [Asimina triloba]